MTLGEAAKIRAYDLEALDVLDIYLFKRWEAALFTPITERGDFIEAQRTIDFVISKRGLK